MPSQWNCLGKVRRCDFVVGNDSLRVDFKASPAHPRSSFALCLVLVYEIYSYFCSSTMLTPCCHTSCHDDHGLTFLNKPTSKYYFFINVSVILSPHNVTVEQWLRQVTVICNFLFWPDWSQITSSYFPNYHIDFILPINAQIIAQTYY